jgi:hypothetical protein
MLIGRPYHPARLFFARTLLLAKSHAITFGRLHTWTLTFHYDRPRDILSIRAPWRDEGRWIDLGEGVQVLADPATGEAVAFRISGFRGFLGRRPDLAELWEQVKPNPITLRRMENTPFIAAFLEHMERLAYDRDQQLDPTAP